MNRLTLDYFRRWWWIMALGGALVFRLGWTIARRPDDPFEFWLFMITLWVGGILLGFDLKHGIARAVLALPLTARQIGRAWWLATIAMPAVGLGVCLFSGAEAFHRFHPNSVLPISRLWMASLFVLPWLATSFTSIYGINNDMIFGTRRERLAISFFAWLAIVTLFGGMLTLQDSSRSPVKFTAYQIAGLVMIVAGWVRAEKFVVGRASFRFSKIRYRNPSGQFRAPAGSGGIVYLVSTSFMRIFLYVAAMVGLMGLLMFWRRSPLPANLNLLMFAAMGSLMSCGVIIIGQVIPVLRQLRLMRAMPVSANSLAAAMIAIAISPLIAVGALVSFAAWLALGSQPAVTVLTSYTFVLAPAALCVFFVARLGGGVAGYISLAVIIFGFQQVQLRLQMFLHLRELPIGVAASVATVCILLAFFLTRQTLRRSSHAYLMQTLPFGNFHGGAE